MVHFIGVIFYGIFASGEKQPWADPDEEDEPAELKRFLDANAHRVALDAVDAPTFLAQHHTELRAVEGMWPKVRFHALREHAGLVFQERLAG